MFSGINTRPSGAHCNLSLSSSIGKEEKRTKVDIGDDEK